LHRNVICKIIQWRY